jgi:2-keto-3-deoxy-L-rhamnonate aldolase RhmA
MKPAKGIVVVILALSAASWPAGQSQAPSTGKGYLEYDASRPQGWAVRDALVAMKATMPLWNSAKQKLLDGKQIFSHTIDRLDVEGYCQAAPHFDYIFFEMQHSTMTWGDIEKMIAACPRAGVPMIRLPNEFEDTVQKATDIGAIGLLAPTVDTVEKAQSVVRYAQFPPAGRRSQGANQATGIWGVNGINYRQTVNANMLIVMMIETPTGVTSAYDIARLPGVDALLVAHGDLGSFSGFSSGSPEYESLVTKIHDSALAAGKFVGAVTAAYARQGGVKGRTDWADYRMNWNGPSFDGWKPPSTGRGGRGGNPQSQEIP